MVERLTCNQQVGGSSPPRGSILRSNSAKDECGRARAAIVQLVERQLAMLEIAGSSPAGRSISLG